MTIEYQAGVKYLLHKQALFETEITGYRVALKDGMVSLNNDGVLTIEPGFGWDGPSGPAIDSSNFMQGSLLHDALYQLIRHDCLPRTARGLADVELYRQVRADGMWRVRAWWVWAAVKTFARRAALPSERRMIRRSP